jgi:hypothetical protein
MMQRLRPLLVVALVLALAPEVVRYAAERRLRGASSALRQVLGDKAPAGQREAALDWIAAEARATAGGLPGDLRPWMVAGTARLAARDGEGALAGFAGAAAQGERAESDLELGRAFILLGRQADAKTALVRAGWVSPRLLARLPPPTASVLEEEVKRLEGELRGGRLTAPPPSP